MSGKGGEVHKGKQGERLTDETNVGFKKKELSFGRKRDRKEDRGCGLRD